MLSELQIIMNLSALLLSTTLAYFGNETYNGLVNCMQNVIQYFNMGTVMVISFGEVKDLQYDAVLKELNLQENGIINLVATKKLVPVLKAKPDNFLVWATENMPVLMDILETLAMLNHRARFVIYIQQCNHINSISEKLQELNVLHVMMLGENLMLSKIDAFSVYPYTSPENCGKSNWNLKIVDNCSVFSRWKFAKGKHFFPNKIPKNLHGCPFQVSSFPWPPFILESQYVKPSGEIVYDNGLEVKLIKEAAKNLNLTLRYLSPPPNGTKWGGRRGFDSWDGIVGNVFYGKADVAFASVSATEERMRYFSPTIAYWTNAVVWVVPRPKYIAGWKGMLIIFLPETWLVLIVIYLLVSVLIYKVANSLLIPKEPMSLRCLPTCLTAIWASVLELPIDRTPKSQILKIIVFCWIVYCMAISTIYKSYLISFLTDPRLGHSIKTFEQLLESRLPLGYTVGLSEYFEDSKVSLKFCSNITSCLNYVAFDNNMSLVSDEWHVKYLIPRYFLDGKAISLLEILEQEVLSYNLVMLFSKRHLLLDSFNDLIYRISESGLLVKWMKDINKNRTLGDITFPEDGWRKLTVENLQSPFYLLLIGLGISFVVFILEVISPKQWHERKTT